MRKVPEEVEDLVVSLAKSVEDLTVEMELLKKEVEELKRRVR